MPRVSNIQIQKKMEQPTMYIRTQTSVEKLPQLIGESYALMAAHLQELGEFPCEVPYVAYYNMDMQNLDVEFGFPVSSKLAGTDSIQSGSIPAGKVVSCMYRGAYAEMGPVYDEMAAWIKDNNLTPVGTAYEHYYNGPEFPESDLLTLIVMPLQ